MDEIIKIMINKKVSEENSEELSEESEDFTG